MLNQVFCLPTVPKLGGFYYAYSSKKSINCAISYFKLKITRCIFFLVYYQVVYLCLLLAIRNKNLIN